jgi:N12 class adenine-specific DNA methylase
MNDNVMSINQTTELRYDYEYICDVMNRDNKDQVTEDINDDEYRDERDGAERLAERHGC